MLLHVWGTDFHRSTGEFRSRLYIAEPERKAVIESLLAMGFRDLAYVATCNRVEFYTTAHDVYADTRPLWIALLKKLGLADDAFYRGYHLEGKSALRHLLRVASSLESFAVGEPQILGQIKDALASTRAWGLPIGRDLDRAFALAFETAKKVRTLSGIGAKPVSVATLGMRRFEAFEAQWPATHVVVVGRSPISVHVLDWFAKHRPATPVTWLNRDVAKIARLPQSQRVKLGALADFVAAPTEFSHVFTATASRDPIFTGVFFESLPKRPRILFDFAQPPDIEQSAIVGASSKLVRMEDLLDEAKRNAADRARAVAAAEAILEASLREFFRAQKEAPILREFSSIEGELEAQAARALATFDPAGADPAARRAWLEKVLRKHLHDAREHLRRVLRTTTEPGHGVGECRSR
ncbi:MAG: hypothetical protein IT522_04885 [Burkholderiales bacterium]|nr:hypothetical protein [Burkholderiales bacterium]